MQLLEAREVIPKAAKKMPAIPGSKTEIRRVPGIEEFPQDNKWVAIEKEWRERTGQL